MKLKLVCAVGVRLWGSERVIEGRGCLLDSLMVSPSPQSLAQMSGQLWSDLPSPSSDCAAAGISSKRFHSLQEDDFIYGPSFSLKGTSLQIRHHSDGRRPKHVKPFLLFNAGLNNKSIILYKYRDRRDQYQKIKHLRENSRLTGNDPEPHSLVT